MELFKWLKFKFAKKKKCFFKWSQGYFAKCPAVLGPCQVGPFIFREKLFMGQSLINLLLIIFLT